MGLCYLRLLLCNLFAWYDRGMGKDKIPLPEFARAIGFAIVAAFASLAAACIALLAVLVVMGLVALLAISFPKEMGFFVTSLVFAGFVFSMIWRVNRRSDPRRSKRPPGFP